MPFSWKELEEVYATYAQQEALRVMRENPQQTFYAIALQESYRELDGQIGLPFLALNSVEALQKQQDTAAPYDMASANWQWKLILVNSQELEHFQKALNAEAKRSTQDHWYRTEKLFLDTMVRVSKQLHATFKKQKQTTEDFCVFFDDEDGDINLIKRCIPKSLYMKHFAATKAETQSLSDVHMMKESGSATDLQKYLLDMYKYEKEIVALGDIAIESLLTKLSDKTQGGQAADLLGQIGVKNMQVISALRQQAQDIDSTGYRANTCAGALAILGDHEYLFEMVENETLSKIAITGLTFPYRAIAMTDRNGKKRPRTWKLDYRNLERLLDRNSPAWTSFVAEKLSPGSGFITIEREEIDEAIRGLKSPHIVLRQHAVCILGDRALGAAAGKLVVPALAECLKDSHANIRRLAILSISYWKGAAKPYLTNIEHLCQDDDEDVRAAAKLKIEQLRAS